MEQRLEKARHLEGYAPHSRRHLPCPSLSTRADPRFRQQSSLQPFAAWWALFNSMFVLLMQGYYVFLSGYWNGSLHSFNPLPMSSALTSPSSFSRELHLRLRGASDLCRPVCWLEGH